MFDTIFNLLMHIPFELRMILIAAICFAMFAAFTYVLYRISNAMPKANKNGKKGNENARYQHR